MVDGYPRKGANWFILLVYFIFSLYFLNYPFSFIKIPEAVAKFDIWIIFIGGILLLFGTINYFRASKRF